MTNTHHRHTTKGAKGPLTTSPTTNTLTPGLIACCHINLHRKSECNIDVQLFAEHLMRRYHIDEHDVVLGLEDFRPDFNYNKPRDSSVTRVTPKPAPQVVPSSLDPSLNLPSPNVSLSTSTMILYVSIYTSNHS